MRRKAETTKPEIDLKWNCIEERYTVQMKTCRLAAVRKRCQDRVRRGITGSKTGQDKSTRVSGLRWGTTIFHLWSSGFVFSGLEQVDEALKRAVLKHIVM